MASSPTKQLESIGIELKAVATYFKSDDMPLAILREYSNFKARWALSNALNKYTVDKYFREGCPKLPTAQKLLSDIRAFLKELNINISVTA